MYQLMQRSETSESVVREQGIGLNALVLAGRVGEDEVKR
jgi:hypothetical protein